MSNFETHGLGLKHLEEPKDSVAQKLKAAVDERLGEMAPKAGEWLLCCSLAEDYMKHLIRQ